MQAERGDRDADIVAGQEQEAIGAVLVADARQGDAHDDARVLFGGRIDRSRSVVLTGRERIVRNARGCLGTSERFRRHGCLAGCRRIRRVEHLLVATLLIGSPAAPLPAGRYHIGSLGRFIAKLVVMGIVLALAKLEGEALTVGRMLQVLGEIADPRVSLFIDADEHDLPRALLAVELEAEDGRRVNCRRHAGN